VQFFRTAVGKIYRAESADGGINWTKAEPTDLPNPNSKLNSIVLSDGQTVIAYNSHDRTSGLKLMRVNLTAGGPCTSPPLLSSQPSNVGGMSWVVFVTKQKHGSDC